MVHNIVPVTQPSLRKKSKLVKKIDKKIHELIKDMKDTLVAQKDPEGVGLAAAQIGKNLRVFIMKPKNDIRVVVNPKIISVSKTKPKKRERKIMEGCLSLPNFYSPLVRDNKVVLNFTDEKGAEQTKVFEGFEAQLVLHEVDHLDGVLFVDHVLEQKKPLYELKDDEWHEVELV